MDPRRRARLLLILGVLLALVAGGLTYAVTSAPREAATPPPPTTDVVVATREIPARTVLTANDVRVAKVNSDAAPPLGVSDVSEVVGKIVTQGISINEPILPDKFALPDAPAFTVFPAGEEFASDSPAYRAFSIVVPAQFAVGGAIVPGDLVDILATINFDPLLRLEQEVPPDPDLTVDFSAKIVLGPIPVLARVEDVYTIRADAETAEQLAYLQASGATLSMLLRAPEDDRAAGTQGVTFVEVYSEFAFPIPARVSP